MTPLKLARIRACGGCAHRRNSRAWPWPRCRYPGFDRELDERAFDGTGGECPGGFWAGVNVERSVLRADALARYRAAAKRFSAPPPPSPLEPAAAERQRICEACENTSCALKTCRGCRRRALLWNPAMVCPADPPKWGPMAAAWPSSPKGRIRVVWTISSHNEGLVGQTVRSLCDSVVDERLDFEVLVVDDASTDGSCEKLGCRVLRNGEPMGIGFNLNRAADEALRMGAEVVGVADAHMKVPAGCVEALSLKAASEMCVTSSATRGWDENSRMEQWGAYLVWKKNDLLAARWMGGKWPRWGAPPRHRPTDEWARVQVPLGASYAYSAETIEALKHPTGRLWETVAGRWGFLLEPFSVKCHLLGIPVYVSRDHWTRHLYRRVNPVADAHRQKVRNIAFGTASVFSPGTWEKYFRRWCATRSGVTAEEVEALAAQARRGVTLPWTAGEEEEFLMAIPRFEDEKEKPVALEKIALAPPRDKMLRSARARKKASAGEEETAASAAAAVR